MKLTEFNTSRTTMAKKALKEHFNTNLNVDKLGLVETKTMLTKVKKLINETTSGNKAHSRQNNPAYLKLMMMENALSSHFSTLKALPRYNQRIVVENEEVEKSQVLLAAQEMIDSIQKMVEQISDMLVKELPAVVDGVNSEIGTNEGEQFNTQASEALSSLQAALTQAQGTMKSALNTITGQGGGFGDMSGAAGGMPGADMGADAGMGGMEAEPTVGDVSGEEPAADLGEPEEEPISGVGRAVR